MYSLASFALVFYCNHIRLICLFLSFISYQTFDRSKLARIDPVHSTYFSRNQIKKINPSRYSKKKIQEGVIEHSKHSLALFYFDRQHMAPICLHLLFNMRDESAMNEMAQCRQAAGVNTSKRS